jgi:hypothetical protein
MPIDRQENCRRRAAFAAELMTVESIRSGRRAGAESRYKNVSAVEARIPALRFVEENTVVKIEPSREFWQVSDDRNFVSEDLTDAEYRQRQSICALAAW